MQPYQSYQRWDPATNTTTQQITYSNGMVIETTYTGRQSSFTTPNAPYQATNMLQPQTPLASIWRDMSNDSLNVQETPLSPVTSHHLSAPNITREPLLIPRDIETAWNYGANPAATAAGGAAKGVEAIEDIENTFHPEPSGIPAAQGLDSARKVAKHLGPIGTVGDAVNVGIGLKETWDTKTATPGAEALGSYTGGALGGMAGGALAGSVVAGPVGTVIGGALGGLAGSELGKKLGHEIGEAIDEADFKEEFTKYFD